MKFAENKEINLSLLSLITILYMCKQSCTNFATAMGFSTSITAGIILIAFVLLFVIYFFTNLQEIRWDGVAILFLCAAFFFITIQIHPEYQARYEDIYNNGRFSAISVFGLGAGLYVYYLFRMYGEDTDAIYRSYKIVPYLIFFLNLPTLIVKPGEYAMDFGYQMEMAAILFLAQYLYEGANKIGKLIFSLIAMSLGVLYGARASILGFLLFILLYLIWRKRITVGRILLLFVGILGVIVYNSQIIMMAIYNLFASFGLHSRTLYLIASGDILASDYARQERIWPVLIELLQNSSLFKMYGAYGDRYYIDTYYPYAHNIVLEVLVTFGKFLGGIILLVILINFVITCKRDKGTAGLLTLAFGCFSICRLMVSSSFWEEPYFWAFLAMMVNCRYIYRKVNPKQDVFLAKRRI